MRKKFTIQSGRGIKSLWAILCKIPRVAKLCVVFAICTVGTVYAADSYSETVRIDLDVKNQTVKDVLDKIETISEFSFFYNNSHLDLNRKVSISVKESDIFKILGAIFAGTDITYTVYDKRIVLSKSDEPLSQSPQTRRISGSVTDETGTPVIGASVVETGTTNGTITDEQGEFSIQVREGAVLQVALIGYQPQEVTVGIQSTLTVRLREDTQTLDEVVVIGYGTRSKRDVTTAISSIGSETVGKSLTMSAESAMQGTMTGVHVSGNSGSPMSRPTIRIRGTNTWGISEPLYVIDGIAITELGAGIERNDSPAISDIRGELNIMTMIDPSDIESISILKDASAAAIYGVRAANGVVLITTKKGRKDKPTVDFNVRYGIQNITQELDWMNTRDYTAFVNKVFATRPDLDISVENAGLFDSNDSRYLGNSPTYDWATAARNKNAPSQDYNVKVSGGTDNTDYYVSLGYSDQQGTLLNNNLNRYSGAVKLNTWINDWVRIGINYRLVKVQGRDQGNDYYSISRAAPWQPIYQTDDIPGYAGYAYAQMGVMPDGTWSAQKLYGEGTRINVLGRGKVDPTIYSSMRNLGTAYLEVTPLKGLIIKGQLNLDMYNTDKYQFTDFLGTAFGYGAEDYRSKGGGKSVGDYNIRDMRNYNLTQELSVNYANSFGNHNLDLLFNFSNQQYSADFRQYGTQYMTSIADYLRFIPEGEAAYNRAGTDGWRWALQGYLFRVGYNYAYKYYLDVTLRRDGSARFAPEKRWGTFPSFSAAWRISSEPFMEGVGWIDDLKLRVGWGQLGNQEVRNMAYLSAITTAPTFTWGNNDYGDPGSGTYNRGATIFSMANRDLSWEKTETLNIGFDSQLFGGLTFSAEYYSKQTKGILQEINLPKSLGVKDMPVANVARVANRGFEFTLNYQNSIGELNYGIGANLTTVRNRVVETYRHIPSGTIEEGHSIYYHKAYKVAGIFQTDEAAKAHQTQDTERQRDPGAGDFYFQDLRGAPKEEGKFFSEGPDGTVNAYDMVDIGNSIPGYFYGFNINLDWKGIDLGLQFSGVGDVIKYNSIKAGNFRPTTGDNVTYIVNNAWTPENKNTTWPRLVQGDPTGNLRYSDFFFESAAYLRLQNLQIGYTLPASFYKAVNGHIRNIRVYAGGSNLFTATPYTGLDPESDAYPIPKVFFMGLSARF